MIKWVNKKRNTKGFTLMELIIVIAILGILAAIALPRFGGFTEKAKLAADKATAATISNAAKLYVASDSKIIENITNGTLDNLDDLIEKGDDAPKFVSKEYTNLGDTPLDIFWTYDLDGAVKIYSGNSTNNKFVPTK